MHDTVQKVIIHLYIILFIISVWVSDLTYQEVFKHFKLCHQHLSIWYKWTWKDWVFLYWKRKLSLTVSYSVNQNTIINSLWLQIHIITCCTYICTSFRFQKEQNKKLCWSLFSEKYFIKLKKSRNLVLKKREREREIKTQTKKCKVKHIHSSIWRISLSERLEGFRPKNIIN